MKILKIAIAGLVFALSSFSLFAQDNALILRHSITINEKSLAQTTKVEIAGEVEKLKIEVMCSLEKGEVIIELFDPEGKRQGKFTLGSKTNLGNQTGDTNKDGMYMEDGKLEKLVTNPVNGDWIIKITPTKASARLSVRSSQVYKK